MKLGTDSNTLTVVVTKSQLDTDLSDIKDYYDYIAVGLVLVSILIFGIGYARRKK